MSSANIKFYIREGLLPAGERTGYNRTEYDDAHVARLRLIQALTNKGGLSIAAAREVLKALDNDESIDVVLRAAHEAIPVAAEDASPESTAIVEDLARTRGWAVWPGHAGIRMAAHALDTFASIDRSDIGAGLHEYARAAQIIAEADLRTTVSSGSSERMAETVVVGTVVGDTLIAGLRRIAQVQASLAHLNLDTVTDEWAVKVLSGEWADREPGDPRNLPLASPAD